jgi:hypothetical protein
METKNKTPQAARLRLNLEIETTTNLKWNKTGCSLALQKL